MQLPTYRKYLISLPNSHLGSRRLRINLRYEDTHSIASDDANASANHGMTLNAHHSSRIVVTDGPSIGIAINTRLKRGILLSRRRFDGVGQMASLGGITLAMMGSTGCAARFISIVAEMNGFVKHRRVFRG